MSDLGPAVETVARRCLGVRAGEEAVIVVDPGTRAIGEALRDAASAAGADAVLMVMDERADDGELTAQGALGTNLAELGVGTNDRARFTGNVLEDEKILGTVHVAFGASAAFGRTVSVPIHLDVVIVDAGLEVDGRQILDAGRYVLDQ